MTDSSPSNSYAVAGSGGDFAGSKGDVEVRRLPSHPTGAAFTQPAARNPPCDSSLTAFPSTSASDASSPTVDRRDPSENRVSISYARGTRRLNVDAEVVRRLVVRRQEGAIEIVVDVRKVGNSIAGVHVCCIHLPPAATALTRPSGGTWHRAGERYGKLERV